MEIGQTSPELIPSYSLDKLIYYFSLGINVYSENRLLKCLRGGTSSIGYVLLYFMYKLEK